KTSIINGSEVSRLSVAIQPLIPAHILAEPTLVLQVNSLNTMQTAAKLQVGRTRGASSLAATSVAGLAV
ncbi:hypothetical protein, partial [Enterobacter hormaechei]